MINLVLAKKGTENLMIDRNLDVIALCDKAERKSEGVLETETNQRREELFHGLCGSELRKKKKKKREVNVCMTQITWMVSAQTKGTKGRTQFRGREIAWPLLCR